MAISKITDAARDAASVGAMADRPNSTARDGYSGLTPEQVKAKFDALPKLNTAKINEIIDLINGTSTSSLAYLMLTPVEYQGETMTLYEFLEAVQDGSFGDIVKIGDITLAAALAAANKIPPGGTTGQLLAKKTGTNYDLKWVDPSGGGGGGGDDEVFWATQGTTPFNDIKNAFLAGKVVMAKGTYGDVYVLTDRIVDEFNDVLVFIQAHGNARGGGSGIIELTVDNSNVWNYTDNKIENSGYITVGEDQYAVQRKALAITENGVTTTYYVADITSGVY